MDVIRFLALGLLGLASVVTGVLFLGYSGLQYLKTGAWVGFSLLDLFTWAMGDPAKTRAMFAEWIGLAKILDFVSVVPVFLIVGAFLMASADD